MSITSRGIRFGSGFAVVLLSLAGHALTAVAQTGAPSSVGVPPHVPEQPLGFGHSMIGIQFGAGQNMQLGTFTCPCGTAFNGGKGTGWDVSAFFELPVGPDFFAGLKAGLDRKNTSSTFATSENVIIETSSGDTSPVTLPTNLTGSLTLTLVSFEPFIQYQIFSTNFFVLIGAGISDLTSSNFTKTRTLASSSITLSDGTTINNVTFTNGSRTEESQNGALSGANSLLFSGILSAGYNFNAGWVTVAPMVTYDYPFSTVQRGENWKITSLYASLSVKFQL